MIHELKDPTKAEHLFEGWEETLIWSCLQGVMGSVFVTDPEHPVSALAFVGCFGFFAGEPDRELVENKPAGFVIMVPQGEAWAALIEECWPSAKRVTRYAIRKDTRFDEAALQAYVEKVPEGYELRPIDAELYDKCLEDPVTRDFVAPFGSKEKYLEWGRGMVILKDGRIVNSGGRVLGVSARGANIEEAIANAYRAVDKISFEGGFCRRDIGAKALKHGGK